jgi:hypothetical protein
VLKVVEDEKEDLLDEHQAVKQLKERSSQLDPTASVKCFAVISPVKPALNFSVAAAITIHTFSVSVNLLVCCR